MSNSKHWIAHSTHPLMAALAAVLMVSCAARVEWTDEQEAVFEAMQAWTAAVADEDTEAMWEMLSPDAQKFYQLERRQLIVEVNSQRTALESEHLSDEDRERVEAALASWPEDPEGMTAQDVYAWTFRDDFTQEGIEAQRVHFSRRNVEAIEVDGSRATVKLRRGDRTRYSWVRDDGDWKKDLPPSKLRELKSARALENEQE